MHRSRFRLLTIAAIAVVSVLAMSVSGVLAQSAPKKASTAGTFVVTGNVNQKLRLNVATIAALPNQQTVEVTYLAGGTPETHVFTGPLLVDVLAKAGPSFDPAIKNDKLRHYASVTASDGYQALVAYGEIDPSFENKKILLAVTQDGAPLDAQGPRLVVPGDKFGGRYVTGVVKVKLDKPKN
jgi:Oxidoreductase molybdopterin binding domain